jgi:protein SCO1
MRGAVLLLTMLSLAGPVRADETASPDPFALPEELEGVGIEQKLDSRLPLDAVFRDEQGEVLRLSDVFTGERPVIVVCAYYKCPMLCGLVLEAVVAGLKGLEWTPGEQFDVVTVSIDARETPELARDKKANVLSALARPGAERGWRFLTGSQASISALTAALGFKYRFLPERNDFAHAAGIFICTPDGRLSQTLLGLEYQPRTLRLALVEAGEGKVGSLVDQIILFCFHYDSKTGRYTPMIMNIVRLTAAAFVLVGGGLVGAMHLRSRSAAAPVQEPATKLGTP